MGIFAAVFNNKTDMKRKKTAVTILLNVLFCGVMLWLFARNSYLRPFSGSYF